MIYEATQHIPGFVDGVEPQRAPVETLADLLGLQWVQCWAANSGFARWSRSGRYLMAEMKDGGFWAIAHVHGDVLATLPVWAGRTSL